MKENSSFYSNNSLPFSCAAGMDNSAVPVSFKHFAEDSAGLEKPPKIAINVKNTVLVYYQYGVNLLNVLKQ